MGILLQKGMFDENKTFKAYDINHVFKCTISNFFETIEKINQMGNGKFLIQIPNTIGLKSKDIANMPNNIDIRVVGGLTNEYAKSTSNNMDYLREKATYSKEEMIEILNKIEKIESGINPNWTLFEKAFYLYEYLKCDITYRTPSSSDEHGMPLDYNGNTKRTRIWDTLTGLTCQISTCSGFAHIYQELCARQNIECVKIGGKYLGNQEGDHAWNIITIDNRNFLVDIIWDAKDYEFGLDHVTGFGVSSTKYVAKCYLEKQQNLSKINEEWIDLAHQRISKLIPKQQIYQEKIANFLKIRELDRKRMMELINGHIEKTSIPTNKERTL